MPRQLFASLVLMCSLCLTSLATAQTPTAQQIEQFQRLPRAQQEQLARQIGIDLNMINGLNSSQTSSQPENPFQGPFPRGTSFDEFGNPILEDPALQDQFEEDEDELKLYGSELFANEPMHFISVTDVPVPADYILGPGDELVVQLYGKENEEHTLTVSREGYLVIPRLGPFAVSSMSFTEAKAFLETKIKEKVIGVEVSISMGELRTIRVFVMGEAYKPGAYSISALSTITNALFASGGVSEIASLRNIQLKRGGELIATLDLYDLLNAGDSSNDAQLKSGDVVFIPPVEKTVSVDGEVRRPAIYELKSETSLQEVIDLAGGKLAQGYEGAISVKRFLQGTQVQLTGDIQSGDMTIQNGDHITVPKVTPFVSNSITLIGAVARPGKYQWREGMKLSALLGNPHRDLLENADMTYVLILRDKSANRDIEVLQSNLTSVIAGDLSQDHLLASNDRVLVFSKVESEKLGDVVLEDLAYTEEELVEFEKEAWEKTIEDKLFWRSVGLDESQANTEDDDELLPGEERPVIQLTDLEKERVLELKNSTYFSRKRMLAPVIAKLREQARFGDPIQVVEIAGEVKVQGLYPLTKNASIKELIIAAGGLTESSYPLKSEVTRTRISDDGAAQIEHINFSPKNVMQNIGAESVKLMSRDRVNIFSIPSWQQELKVTVVGEVEFPGEYTIKRGENLSDLMDRVGGLTSFGDAQAAVFTRESLKEQERKNLKTLAEELRKQIASEGLRRQAGDGAIVSYDEAKKLLRDLTKAEAVGRLVIDFEALLAGQSNADISLEDGDVLYVPGLNQAVNVVGEVYVPTSHLFASGLSYEDYINRSGGFRKLADEDSTYIIRSNGSVEIPRRDSGFWFAGANGKGSIRPGDTIVVPFDSESIDGFTVWANATQIIYQLAVAVAAIGSL